MSREIKKLVKRDKDRTMRHAAVGNELIDALNAILKLGVSPDRAGSFSFSDGNGKLKLNTVDLVACDESGNQKTFRLIGFELA